MRITVTQFKGNYGGNPIQRQLKLKGQHKESTMPTSNIVGGLVKMDDTHLKKHCLKVEN